LGRQILEANFLTLAK